MNSGIYTITNILTNQIYVGKTENFKIRWRNHRNTLRSKFHDNEYLQNSWNKYGEENFLFEVLIYCDKKYIHSEENYWCNLLQVHKREFGYNIALTNPENKCIMSDESKNKIREKATGRNWSDEYKEIFRLSQLGRKHSAERIIKASMANYKPVLQYDRENNFIKEWESLKSAATSIGAASGNIGNCCRGIKQRTAKGFIWKFKSDVI